jgi:nitrate reductase beta subunit
VPVAPPAGAVNTLSNPLTPNVPNLYAPWTYHEILITVPAQQLSPDCATDVSAHGTDVKVEWTANCGQAAEAWEDPTGSSYCA